MPWASFEEYTYLLNVIARSEACHEFDVAPITGPGIEVKQPG
jgi:hypothetical protein